MYMYQGFSVLTDPCAYCVHGYTLKLTETPVYIYTAYFRL